MFFRGAKQEMLAMTLEGGLGPNGRLDDADALPIAKPEAICVNRDGQLLVSSGSDVLLIRQWGQEPERWGSFDAPVSALAVKRGRAASRSVLPAAASSLRTRRANASPGWTPSSSSARDR